MSYERLVPVALLSLLACACLPADQNSLDSSAPIESPDGNPPSESPDSGAPSESPDSSAPIPASEDAGTSASLFEKAVGETFLAESALQRAIKWNFGGIDLSISKRAQALAQSAYDSSNAWTGANCVTPVKDQGDDTEMCWIFAATAALESSYCISLGKFVDASEQTAMECFSGDAVAAERPYTLGSEIRAYDVMRRVGSPQEVANPYNFNVVKPCITIPVASQEYYGVEGVTTLTHQVATGLPSVDDIKRGIVDNGAVTMMVRITPKWSAYVAHGAPTMNSAADIIDPLTSLPYNGMHEVAIVGWDDVRGAWRFKNSYTAKWGTQGFGWIVYNDNAILPGFFTHVTPTTKRDPSDITRIVRSMLARLIVIPQLWADNPLVHFPRSLGFPRSKVKLVDGVKFAIKAEKISQSVVNSWPSYVRDLL